MIWAKGNFACPHNGWFDAGVPRAVFFVFTPTDRGSRALSESESEKATGQRPTCKILYRTEKLTLMYD